MASFPGSMSEGESPSEEETEVRPHLLFKAGRTNFSYRVGSLPCAVADEETSILTIAELGGPGHSCPASGGVAPAGRPAQSQPDYFGQGHSCGGGRSHTPGSGSAAAGGDHQALGGRPCDGAGGPHQLRAAGRGYKVSFRADRSPLCSGAGLRGGRATLPSPRRRAPEDPREFSRE